MSHFQLNCLCFRIVFLAVNAKTHIHEESFFKQIPGRLEPKRINEIPSNWQLTTSSYVSPFFCVVFRFDCFFGINMLSGEVALCFDEYA